MTITTTDFTAQRVRHPLKARLMHVLRIAHVTPKMVRVTFHGPDLADFVSSSFDDHIKLFFPPDGQAVMPEASPDGLRFPEHVARPPARDYTPRRYRPELKELDIDFLLHGDGPASNWVARAQVGDALVSAGPKGSFIIPDAFDWQLMIGDETALPAMMRRLESLPAGRRVHVLALVQNMAEEQAIETRADVRYTWIYRLKAGDDALLDAVRDFVLPAGEGYIWGAGEAAQMRAIHEHLLSEKGVDKSRMRVSNYWTLAHEGKA